jgi:hypothetical protein
MSSAPAAPEVTTELFGGTFVIDGSGFYPGLELINLVVTSLDGPLPSGDVVQVRRVAHDFARRLIRDGGLTEPVRRNVILDEHTEVAVGKLFRCLELPTPNVVKAKSWGRTHFFPYSRSLVHWDARVRYRAKGEEVSAERIYLRGGGAYAFTVLRKDPNVGRRQAVQDGFNRLYPLHDDSPLDRIAAVLRAQGYVDSDPVEDVVERKSVVVESKWTELYRDGIANILSYVGLPSVQRVRALMSWTGIWIVLLQASESSRYVNAAYKGIILDCAGEHAQLRRAAQRSLKESLSVIGEASLAASAKLGSKLNASQLGQIKGFFASTASTCGLLNSAKGRRHFTLKLDAIESLVMASVREGEEREFESFAGDWLFGRCQLVIGRSAAESAGLLDTFDATIFEENERALAERIRATGMLRVYSDATRMVAAGAVQ